jgi:hypothetical protein
MAVEAAVGRSDTDFRAQRPPCRWKKEHASERGDFEAEHAIYAAQQVVHETQYFAAPLGTSAWRAALAEPMPGRTVEDA